MPGHQRCKSSGLVMMKTVLFCFCRSNLDNFLNFNFIFMVLLIVICQLIACGTLTSSFFEEKSLTLFPNCHVTAYIRSCSTSNIIISAFLMFGRAKHSSLLFNMKISENKPHVSLAKSYGRVAQKKVSAIFGAKNRVDFLLKIFLNIFKYFYFISIK